MIDPDHCYQQDARQPTFLQANDLACLLEFPRKAPVRRRYLLHLYISHMRSRIMYQSLWVFSSFGAIVFSLMRKQVRSCCCRNCHFGGQHIKQPPTTIPSRKHIHIRAAGRRRARGPCRWRTWLTGNSWRWSGRKIGIAPLASSIYFSLRGRIKNANVLLPLSQF